MPKQIEPKNLPQDPETGIYKINEPVDLVVKNTSMKSPRATDVYPNGIIATLRNGEAIEVEHGKM